MLNFPKRKRDKERKWDFREAFLIPNSPSVFDLGEWNLYQLNQNILENKWLFFKYLYLECKKCSFAILLY